MYPYFPYVPRSALFSFRPNWPVGGIPFSPPVPHLPHYNRPPLVPLPYNPIPVCHSFPNPHAAYWAGVQQGIFDPSKLTIIQTKPLCPALFPNTRMGPVDIIESTEGYVRRARSCYYDRIRKVLVFCPTENAEDDIILTHPVSDRVNTQDRANDRNFITQEGLLHYIADLEISSHWKTAYMTGVSNTRVKTVHLTTDGYVYNFPNGLVPMPSEEDTQSVMDSFKETYGAFYLDRFLECPMWTQILSAAQVALASGTPFYIPLNRDELVAVLSVDDLPNLAFTVRHGNEIIVFHRDEQESHPYTTRVILYWTGPEDTEFYKWKKTVAVCHGNRFPEDIDDGHEIYDSSVYGDGRDGIVDTGVILTNFDQTKRFYIRVFTVNDMDITDYDYPWELIIDQGVVVSDNRSEP